ncbi:MAG TPA: cytochrome D1 domain-containing protein [Granulicella sp.]
MGVSLVVCLMGARAQSLLVVNQGDATVSVIDPQTDKQVATIAEHVSGVHGHEIAVSADGKTAFLPIYGSVGVGKPGIDGHEMLILDVPSRRIIDHVDFGHGVRPHMPLLDEASGMLYVTTELDKTVTVIDPKTYRIVGAIPTGAEQSHMLILSHDGKTGYTANVGPGSVSVLDMRGRKTLAVIPVATGVQRIAISNDDKWVFTSDVKQPRMAVIDTSTRKVAKWIELPGLGYGAKPTADGKLLLVAIPAAGKVAVVDLATMTVKNTVEVPLAPQEVVIRPDQKVAYVSCNTSGKVAAIDLATWKTDLIAVGPQADGMIWVP